MLIFKHWCSRHRTAYKQKHTHPLVTAVERNNADILKLFKKYSYSISEPHVTGCECDDCVDDKLGQQYNRLSTLKALSSPLWIALTSDDPFLTSFKLHRVIHNFMRWAELYEKIIFWMSKIWLTVDFDRNPCSQTSYIKLSTLDIFIEPTFWYSK